MKSILLVSIFAYSILCITLYFFQRNLIYFPTQYMTNYDAKDIYFESDSIKLQGWLANEGKEDALIYYGGNAENIELNIIAFKELFPNRSIYLINYRAYGNSEGSPSEKNIFKDASNIFDELKQKHKNISLLGRSLGSGVATFIASKKEVDKLILITPYDSVLNVAKDSYGFLPVKLLLKDPFLSTEYVKDIKAKTLIIYAGKDEVIKPQRTENLIASFNKDILETILIEEANHNDIVTFNEYYYSINKFFLEN